MSAIAQLPQKTGENFDENFDPFSLSLVLQAGASAKTFARIWPIVESVQRAFEPDFVILQCGVDGLAGDPCKVWNWTIDAELPGSLGWCVNRVLHHWQGRKVDMCKLARSWSEFTINRYY